MTQMEAYIKDAESDAGVELTYEVPDDVLCDGLGCRHSECSCWDSFDFALRELLEKQKLAMWEVSDCHKVEIREDDKCSRCGEFCEKTWIW
jgi:hypothetical protein